MHVSALLVALHTTRNMKTASIATVLAAATATLAADTSALKPLELTNLNAGIYSASMPTTTLFSFSLKDPNTNTSTTCSGYWSAGMAGHKSYDCSDKAYQLHILNGVYNIENFDLGVYRADGSVTGNSTVSGDLWKCEKQEAPRERCNWDGVFKLEVVASS
ncbi:unnamed protein product [Penicillium salamii]|nr:unnamed protein product [Penicillium salamii]